MSRYYEPISLEDFQQKLDQEMFNALKKKLGGSFAFEKIEDVQAEHSGWREAYFINDAISSRIRNDLSQIYFDFENAECGTMNIHNHDFYGYHTLSNGMPFLGCCGGGLWEQPIEFIIYWDGKTFRAYIPTDGNVFNKELKCAYGSEQEVSDYWEEPEEERTFPRANFDLIREDIMGRIQARSNV